MSVFSEQLWERFASGPLGPVGDGLCAGCVVAGQVAALEYIDAALRAREGNVGDGTDQTSEPVFAPGQLPWQHDHHPM